MMLGHPEGVVTETIHQLGHRLGLVEDGGEVFVEKPAIVNRSAGMSMCPANRLSNLVIMAWPPEKNRRSILDPILG
jgi:hypothetical protein